MQATVGRIVLGFIAAMIAVAIAHEGIIYGLTQAGWIRGSAWGLQPIPPWGVPRLINNMFWGGLWGALFALIYDRLPGNAAWLKGLIYGLSIVVVSNWLLLPLIKGQIFGQPGQVLFGGGDPQRMWPPLVIVGGYGLALGVIYGIIGRKATA
jgi:hypothetical protein